MLAQQDTSEALLSVYLLLLLEQFCTLLLKGGDDFFIVTHHANIGPLIDGSIRIAVYCHDGFRVAAACHMLRGTRNGAGNVQFRADDFARQAHLHMTRHPAFVHRRT